MSNFASNMNETLGLRAVHVWTGNSRSIFAMAIDIPLVAQWHFKWKHIRVVARIMI